MFFSFDGIDGVGKSTQIALFCDWLRDAGHTVVECRDPGSTPLGDRLREIVLHSTVDTPIGQCAEMLLYMAARAQLVEQVIRPALDRGEVVVSDRFLLANVVYQGHAGGLGTSAVKQVGEVAVQGVRPHCTFLLDLDPATADARIEGPRDRLESRGLEYRQRLRQGFLDEAARDATIHVVDALASIEQVRQAVRLIAEETIAKRG